MSVPIEVPCEDCKGTGQVNGEGWCTCKKGREYLNRALQFDDEFLAMGGAMGIRPRKPDYRPDPCSVCGERAHVLFTGPIRYRHPHKEDCWVPRDPVGFEKPKPGCHCIRCGGDIFPGQEGSPFKMRMMALCPTCGNKRCPHSTNHVMACTHSNMPEQLGSDYCTPTRPDGTPIPYREPG